MIKSVNVPDRNLTRVDSGLLSEAEQKEFSAVEYEIASMKETMTRVELLYRELSSFVDKVLGHFGPDP